MTSPFVGEQQGIAPLFLQGGAGDEMPLNVAGPKPASGVATLFTQGPEANNLTLWIGKDINASGNVPLYLEAPWAVGNPGHTLEQVLMPLAVSGTTHYNTNSITTLSIDGPALGICAG